MLIRYGPNTSSKRITAPAVLSRRTDSENLKIESTELPYFPHELVSYWPLMIPHSLPAKQQITLVKHVIQVAAWSSNINQVETDVFLGRAFELESIALNDLFRHVPETKHLHHSKDWRST